PRYFFLTITPSPCSPPFPYTTLFRSLQSEAALVHPRVRDLEPRLVDHLLPVEQQVEVERARPTRRNRLSVAPECLLQLQQGAEQDRKSTRLNSSHVSISYAVFCLKKK